jgi:hypothetical protein
VVHVQAPPLQIAPPVHSTPQPPQLVALLVELTQVPAHSSIPPGQAQVPAEQILPVSQTMPQPPQFVGSLEVVTHLPPQSTVSTGQLSTQVPPAQT